MTATACSVTALAGYAAGEMGPAAAELTEKWNISNVVYQLNITIFCIGFATAPMVLAPFSEINGRRPIFIASGILFVGESYYFWRRFDTNKNANSKLGWLRRNRVIRRASRRQAVRGYCFMYVKIFYND